MKLDNNFFQSVFKSAEVYFGLNNRIDLFDTILKDKEIYTHFGKPKQDVAKAISKSDNKNTIKKIKANEPLLIILIIQGNRVL